MEEVRHFITVDWCNKGKRGIFCCADGGAFSKDEPWSECEMFEEIGAFALVLAPESIPLTKAELSEYNRYYPLAEYKGQYGVVRKG